MNVDSFLYFSSDSCTKYPDNFFMAWKLAVRFATNVIAIPWPACKVRYDEIVQGVFRNHHSLCLKGNKLIINLQDSNVAEVEKAESS